MATLEGTRNYTSSDPDLLDYNHVRGERPQEQQQQQQQQEFVGPTLYISRTHKNIRRERIFAVLRQLKLGWVGKIDMVPKQSVERNPDGTVFTRDFVSVFIHFTKWFTQNHQTQQFLDRLDSQGFVHIVYDEPRFWKITKYVPKEHKPQPQSRYPRPRIDFGATNENVEKTTNRSTSASSAAPIVPVQVTRRLQSVSVNSESETKKKYWKQQAEIATAATMSKHHYSSSPTPRSHGSDSESSPSPIIQRKVSVRLFDNC
jgi:hypothetical protein